MKEILTFIMLVLSMSTAVAVRIENINIRDPFILNDNGVYYMYSTKDTTDSNGNIRGGVAVYMSEDMKDWHGPNRVMSISDDNALKGTVWAPEVHKYNGKYYLFATINSDLKWKQSNDGEPDYVFRGTQIFFSDSPTGPFKSFGRFPHTRLDYMALDGTLWIENGTPYMVYCHEWVQIGDGTIELVELSENLSNVVGEPMVLFHGSTPEWSDGLNTGNKTMPKGYVTDGCYLYRTKLGRLLMIWSSFSNGNYAIGVSESTTGSVKGPWKHNETPLFSANGGHGMIFKTNEGQLCLILHQPNHPSGAERAQIYPLEDCGATIRLK